MKIKTTLIVTAALLSGCAAYSPPPNQPTSVVQIEMPDLSRNIGYPDDNGIIQFFDGKDVELRQRIGFHRLSTEIWQGEFKLPAGKDLIINAIYNLAVIGSLKSCNVTFPMPSEIGARYALTVRYNDAARECIADLSVANSKDGPMKRIGRYTGSTKESRIRVKVGL